jgi:Dockerin type I domain
MPTLERLEARMCLNVEWRNPVDNIDVTQDRRLSPLDALLVINELNGSGSRALVESRQPDRPYLDVSGDSWLTPIDALLVINRLNAPFRSNVLSEEGSTVGIVTISVGQESGTRSYEIDVAPNLAPGDNSDSFELAINDSRSIDDFSNTILTLTNAGATYDSALAQWDGSRLRVDLTELSIPETAYLHYRLLNHDNKQLSTVNLTPFSNRVNPVGEKQEDKTVSFNLNSNSGTTEGKFQSEALVGNGILRLDWNAVLWFDDGESTRQVLSGVSQLLQSMGNGGVLPIGTIVSAGKLQQTSDGINFNTIGLSGPVIKVVKLTLLDGKEVLLALQRNHILWRIDESGGITLGQVSDILASTNAEGRTVVTLIQDGMLKQSLDGVAFSTIDLGGKVNQLAEVRDTDGRQILIVRRIDGVLWTINSQGATYTHGAQSLLQSYASDHSPVATVLRSGKIEQSHDGRTYSVVDVGEGILSIAEVWDSSLRQVLVAQSVNNILFRFDKDGMTFKAGVTELLQSYNSAGAPVITVISSSDLQQSVDALQFSSIDLGGPVADLAAVEVGGLQVLLARRTDDTVFRFDKDGATHFGGVTSLVQSFDSQLFPVALIVRNGQLQQTRDGLNFESIDLSGRILWIEADHRNLADRQVIAYRQDGTVFELGQFGRRDFKLGTNGQLFLNGMRYAEARRDGNKVVVELHLQTLVESHIANSARLSQKSLDAQIQAWKVTNNKLMWLIGLRSWQVFKFVARPDLHPATHIIIRVLEKQVQKYIDDQVPDLVRNNNTVVRVEFGPDEGMQVSGTSLPTVSQPGIPIANYFVLSGEAVVNYFDGTLVQRTMTYRFPGFTQALEAAWIGDPLSAAGHWDLRAPTTFEEAMNTAQHHVWLGAMLDASRLRGTDPPSVLDPFVKVVPSSVRVNLETRF